MNFKDENDYPVMLSICVPTYNHERYIRQALESIFMQKTQYTYEILVGEDKSTDNTRSILEEIEKEGHQELKVYYRNVNLHNSDKRNAIDLMDKAVGKYLIFLEGDDFWIDENKIESQISFLENHHDYIAVAHNCLVVDNNSDPTNEEYEECKDEDYTFSHYACEIMPGQTASVMMRNFRYHPEIDLSFIKSKSSPGDRKEYFTFLCYGKVRCLQTKMSAYRHITQGGDSYSATYVYNYFKIKDFYNEQREFAKRNMFKKAYIISDYMMYAAIRQAFVLHHAISLISFIYELRNVDHLFSCNIIMIKRDFLRYVLKKKIFFPEV